MSLHARAVHTYQDHVANENRWLREHTTQHLARMLEVSPADIRIEQLSGTSSPPWVECEIDELLFRVEVHNVTDRREKKDSNGGLTFESEETIVQMRRSTSLVTVKGLVDVGRLLKDEPIPGDDLAEWPVAEVDEPEPEPAS